MRGLNGNAALLSPWIVVHKPDVPNMRFDAKVRSHRGTDGKHDFGCDSFLDWFGFRYSSSDWFRAQYFFQQHNTLAQADDFRAKRFESFGRRVVGAAGL